MLARENCILSAFSSALSEAFLKQSHRTQCLIVGGGSAGLMLGVLLARAGVSVRLL
jgi:ribulose 1,5-bisphosphate synthetase/thiazole synthase